MMILRSGNERSHIAPRDVRQVQFASNDDREAICQAMDHLADYGIHINQSHAENMRNALAFGMDSNLVPGITTPSITTPVQFLQTWLPGFVEDITAARKIDMLVGITTQGSWEDEEIVQGVLERLGEAKPYTDLGNTKMTGWNVNFERRTIVRFEEGMEVGVLEERRAARIRANVAETKRSSAARNLEISRNSIGFYGYNDGANRTYGILNDPNLPPYQDSPTGGWATATFQQIKNDILSAIRDLRVQSQEVIDVKRDPITMAIAMSAVDYLDQVTDFNISVADWMRKAYPNIRVESCPEFDSADPDNQENIFYLYAETVGESGTDDTRTWVQCVPTKFFTLGVRQDTKSYTEAYSNATAGVMLKRPYAVVRYRGI